MFCFCFKNTNLSTKDKSSSASTSPPPSPPPSPSSSIETDSKNNNTSVSDKILHEHLNRLIDLNIKYNIEFNIITNEINKIKLSRENKEVFELDAVRKYTPTKIYSSVSDEEIKTIKIRTRGISAPPQLCKNTENVSYV